MENRVAARVVGGVSNLPRVGGVAGDNDDDNEKVYYGFGVFMGLPLADLKTMKDDFVEQQALTGGPPRRCALSPSTVVENHTHCVENDENGPDQEGDVYMAPSCALQQQQQQQQQHSSHMRGYEQRQHDEGQPREFMDKDRSRFIQDPPSDEQGGEEDDGDGNSDGSDDFGNKSHSLNFILH